VGAVVRGTVTSLREFGAFVDIGGVEALIHVSELSYERVGNPADVLAVGQTVEAQVRKARARPERRPGASRLVASCARARSVEDRRRALPAGATVNGRFAASSSSVPSSRSHRASRGSFTCPVSRSTGGSLTPVQVVTIGNDVEVTIVSVDPEKRRIALSMVESTRRARDAAEIAESRETTDLLARSNVTKSLGTLADLLAARKKPKV